MPPHFGVFFRNILVPFDFSPFIFSWNVYIPNYIRIIDFPDVLKENTTFFGREKHHLLFALVFFSSSFLIFTDIHKISSCFYFDFCFKKTVQEMVKKLTIFHTWIFKRLNQVDNKVIFLWLLVTTRNENWKFYDSISFVSIYNLPVTVWIATM